MLLFSRSFKPSRMPTMFLVPDHHCECLDCHHKFLTFKPDELPGPINCPECGSLNVTGGPLKHGGPFDENSLKHF